LSEVAPDAVVQRAMRHTSPETKRRYRLRKAVEEANTRLYGRRKALHLRDSRVQTEEEASTAVCK
jgi:hypothetical protein